MRHHGRWLDISILVLMMVTIRLQGIVTSGLQGYWHFDYNLYDSSGNSHTGSPQGGAGYSSSGFIGNCLWLDGNGDAVLVPNGDGGLTPSTTITLDVWINLNTYQSGYRDIFTNFSQFRFAVWDGYLAVYSAGSWWSPGSFRLPKHQWTHVCFTYDGNTKKLYMNGILKRSESEQDYLHSSSQAGISSSDYSIDACIDEMKVYNRTLTETEVFQNYYTDKYGYWDASKLNLVLNYPNSGSITLTAGEDAGIRWEPTPLAGDAVKIEVFRDGSLLQVITNNTANDGYLNWRVSYMLESGSGYQIKITSLSNSSVQVIGQPFSIQFTGPVPVKKEARIYQIQEKHIPQVDGNPDDLVWQFAEPESLLYGGAVGDYGVSWTHWQDNLVVWKAVWCEATNKIYLSIRVTDDVQGISDNEPDTDYYSPDQDECLEFYMDGDMSGGNYWPLFTTAQGFRVSTENIRHLLHYPSAEDYPAPYEGDAFITAVQTGDTGDWMCEAEFLIYNHFTDDLKVLTEGTQIGWDLWYNDSDNESFSHTYLVDHQTGWYYNGQVWKDADEMGILSLGGSLEIPGIQVHMPDGWESGFLQEDEVDLAWQTTAGVGNVQVDLYEGDLFAYTIASSITSESTYTWAIPSNQEPGNQYKIRVSSTLYPQVYDQTNTPFEINAIPGLFLTVPADTGNYIWYTEENVQIQWTSQGDVGDQVSITLMKEGIPLYEITGATENDGSYLWEIPDDMPSVGSDFQVRVTSLSSPGVSVTGAPVIWLEDTQHLLLVFPDDENIVLHVDSTYQILWESEHVDDLAIELWHEDTLVYVISDSATVQESFAWQVPHNLIPDAGYRIRIVSLSQSSAEFFSTDAFDIIFTPQIEVAVHYLDTILTAGDSLSVIWETTGNTGETFVIDLYSEQQFYMCIMDRVENVRSYTWMIPGDMPDLPDCYIKVSSCTDTTVYDYNDTSFDILSSTAAASVQPLTTTLKRNFPNPFNPSTTIQYDLAKPSDIRLTVYDIRGRCMYRLKKHQAPGAYQIEWDARDLSGRPLPGGVYVCRLEAGEYTAVRKMVVVK